MSAARAGAGVISNLTGEQRLAAATSQSGLFIEASPGTGKTTVSAQRFGVQRFASAHRHDRRAVVAVSFTRAATQTLRQRVQRLWGPAAVAWPHRIVTLDTIMIDLLQDLMRHGLVSWPGAATLWPDGNVTLDVRDSWASISIPVRSKAFYRLDLDDDRVVVRQAVAHDWAARFPLEVVKPFLEKGMCTHEDVRAVLTLALRNPASTEQVRQRIGETMRALIVDEVFDANDLDITVIEMAVAAGIAVTLVGDPWQALYMFRGARPQAIPDLLQRTGMKTLHLSESFRWQSDEQHNLAQNLRAGRGISLPPDHTNVDVVLALHWAELWDLGGKVLPLAFHAFKGGYEEAAAILLLNHLTRTVLDLDATYLNDALTALAIDDHDVPRQLEPELQEVIDMLRPGGKDAANKAYAHLTTIIGSVSTRELRPAHRAHTKRLVVLQSRITFPGRPVPGLSTHQAKGGEWPRVGVCLRSEGQEALANGLDSSNDTHRKIYVACTRAQERTVQFVPKADAGA